MKTSDPDKKRVEELSAKEQECRRKFKEKFNKLKKMPIPSQPTINVNSEGLTEGELTIENVKRKFKQIFSKFFKESLPSATPELEKTVGKKQPNDIKVCIGTKPIESAIYRFTCVLPLKRTAAASKDIESMICKPVSVLPEQYVNHEQIVLISKDKTKTENNCATGNSDRIVLPPKPQEKEKPSSVETPENKDMTTNGNLKPLKTSETASASAPTSVPTPASKPEPAPTSSIKMAETKENPLNSEVVKSTPPTIDLAPDDVPKTKPDGKSLELVSKEKVAQPIHPKEVKSNNVRGGILSSIVKNFAFSSKLFKPKTWISGKSKGIKMKMMPFSTSISKIPLRWRQGFVILGTFIPFYYTYHKIVTDDKLTTMISEKN